MLQFFPNSLFYFIIKIHFHFHLDGGGRVVWLRGQLSH